MGLGVCGVVGDVWLGSEVRVLHYGGYMSNRLGLNLFKFSSADVAVFLIWMDSLGSSYDDVMFRRLYRKFSISCGV